MRKKTARGARDSALAHGWRVEGDSAAAEAAATEVDRELDAQAEAAAGSAPTGSFKPVGKPVRQGDTAQGMHYVSEEDGGDPAAAVAEAQAPAGVSNGTLVALGVFGGLYLLYTWGWFIVASAYSSFNQTVASGSGAFGGVLQQIVFWAAPLAPVLWFGTALFLARGKSAKRLSIMLAIGAVVLLPLPMLVSRGF